MTRLDVRAARARRRRAPARGDRRRPVPASSPTSSTPGRAATRSSSRSCSPPAARRSVPATVTEAVLARVAATLAARRSGCSRCWPPPAGGSPTRCSSTCVPGELGRRCARRGTPGCCCASATTRRGAAARAGRRGGLRLARARRAAALHREIGAALAATGAPAAELADQWHRAGEREEALAASVDAGLEAGRCSRSRRRAAPRARARAVGLRRGRTVPGPRRAAVARGAGRALQRRPRARARARPRGARAASTSRTIRRARRASTSASASTSLGRRGRARLLRQRARCSRRTDEPERARLLAARRPRADGSAPLGGGARVLRGGAPPSRATTRSRRGADHARPRARLPRRPGGASGSCAEALEAARGSAPARTPRAPTCTWASSCG